ncbi:putative ribonuclease H-like domain-containing protein [Tanacetum coccineum]
MNKPEIETMSIDDLYNNFKIVEQNVKKSVGASSGAQNLAFMTAPSTSSTNDANTASPQVSTASPNVNTASPQVSTASFSDNVVYDFMVENPNCSNLLHQDLVQIHEDDLEAMDLKRQLSLLSMRAKRYYQRTSKKNFINANDTAGYDKSKVECFNCHKMGHFARECRAPRSKEEEQVQINMALMAFSYSEFEKVKQEKEGIEFKIEKFDKASKDLDKLPKKLDLYYSGLDEFKEPEFKGYGSRDSKKESNVVCDKKSYDSKENFDNSLVKEQVSKDTSSFVESSLNVDKETVFPVDKKVESVKPKNHENPVKKSVRYAEMYRLQTPKRNQRNWNGQKSNQLGSDFVMYKKACFICGSFNHVQAQCKYHQRERMVYGNNYNRVNYNYTTKRTHPNAQRNMVPRAVLMKTGLKPFNTATTVNTAHPKSIVFSAKPIPCFSKTTQATIKRPFQYKTVLTNKRLTQKVNTAKAQAVNTAGPKIVKTARPNFAVVIAVRVNQANVVKASACWVWRPTKPDSALGKPQQDDTGFVYSGCSRHMTGNIAYLSNFKEFDGGYVTFGGGTHGGRISSKGIIKIDSLDFEDVYFVNELKFNLFSVSQMCDKKNYALFTNTECLVLSPNFKLPDENQILLKIPRKDNMYNFDMKNIVPKESLTCLVAKATLDESMLLHKRLGHINFKNINKLVKDNLGSNTELLNLVLVVKPHNKTPYELFSGFKPALSFMKPFGCYATILNTLDSLGKFNGKSDEGFFVGYSFSSKAFRVYNTRTMRVKENLHIGFLENKPMIEGNGPKWLFDIDSLTQSMNYVPVAAGIIINESVDASYFDSLSMDVDNGEPKSAADDQKQVEDGLDNENDAKDKSNDDSSPKEVNAVGQHVTTASSTLEATHVEFFSDEDEPKVDLGNITNSYTVWILVDLPIGKRAIGTKWVFRNKKDERGIVIRNKARLVAQGHRQEEGFKDPDHPDKVYKVVKALYGLHQAPRAWIYVLDLRKLMKDKFQMSSMGELTFFLGLQVQQKEDGIFTCQDKYVAEILKKFNYTNVKSASTLVDLEKPLVKDGDVDDVDVHLYRYMIGSLMYLTASRPDIIYLKGKPTLGLWYLWLILFELVAYTDSDYIGATQDKKSTTGGCQFLGNRLISWQCKKQTVVATSITEAEYVAAASCCGQLVSTASTSVSTSSRVSTVSSLCYFRDSPFELVAYTDSDYAGATQDRKSTTGGCQFLGNRLISWQCKKQTVVATSTTEAEYVAAASCCGQVLWIQNQLLDYGYNFMNTVINIDNNSTICIIENPVQHSKTKHIEIRHHFIRDCNAKKLIQMVKIHTDYNVADLLTKGFDAGRFQYLVSSIGMLNP